MHMYNVCTFISPYTNLSSPPPLSLPLYPSLSPFLPPSLSPPLPSPLPSLSLPPSLPLPSQELLLVKEELKQARAHLSSWQDSWKQAKQACDAWKREAEDARHRTDREKERNVRERDEVRPHPLDCIRYYSFARTCTV